jgi:phospholipid/cholesterol/gamma-HCH transport system substrate-binding protein
MAQRKQLSWSELRVGIFVLAGILVVVVGVFYVTGAGAWGAKYRLVTYLPEVNGLAVGAPVTLDGVVIGNVEVVRMAPRKLGQTRDDNRNVEVVMRIKRDFQEDIRSDSKASLITSGFVGDRDVTIERGYTGAVLRDGQEVPAVEQKSIQEVVERSADLMQNLNTLTAQVNGIASDIHGGKGTLGKLVEDQSVYSHLDATIGHLDQVATSIQQGQGTLGKLVASDELYAKLNSVTGHVDNVMAAVEEQKGTLGKLIYDPSFHDDAKTFLDNSNALISGVRDGKGTLGKLATDDTLYTSLRQVTDNLKEATSKLNSNNNSAGKFFSDPQFYDNLSGLTGDLRLLVGDFRTNPKKFLKVKFSIF